MVKQWAHNRTMKTPTPTFPEAGRARPVGGAAVGHSGGLRALFHFGRFVSFVVRWLVGRGGLGRPYRAWRSWGTVPRPALACARLTWADIWPGRWPSATFACARLALAPARIAK